ncbi:unnamed protein product, partial [marine sediment metagenome]
SSVTWLEIQIKSRMPIESGDNRVMKDNIGCAHREAFRKR